MKKYIIMVFVFFGLVLGAGSVLAEEKESLSINDFASSGFLNASIDQVTLQGIIKSTKNEYKEIYLYVVNEKGDDVFYDKCVILSKKSPILTSISISEEKEKDFSGYCKVDWDISDSEKVIDGKYKVIAKSFLGLEEKLKEATYDTVKKFVINEEGNLYYFSPIITIDRIAPIITLTGKAEVSMTRGEDYIEQGATTDDGSEVFIDKSEVDTSTVGTYKVIYTAIDEAGNEATAERIVVVENPTRRSSSSGSYVGRVTPIQNIVVPPATGEVLGAESYFFTSLLKLGSTGAEVMELQKFLNINGYESGLADGKFGPITKSSVIRFQLANGLVTDGIVGPLTRAVLNK